MREEGNGSILSVLDRHGIDEAEAWKAALALELDRKSTDPLKEFLRDNGVEVLQLFFNQRPARAPVAPATDGGGEDRKRRTPKGSPQRRKFVGQIEEDNERAERARRQAEERADRERRRAEEIAESEAEDPASEGEGEGEGGASEQ